MAFVRFNGWDVPLVAAGEAVELIGERGRALDGSVLEDRRATKRRWALRTKHVKEMVAEAIKGTVLGLGHSWTFDDDFYSGKGLSPGSTVGSRRIGTAADGATVVDAAGVAESKYGTNALTVEPGATNVLSQNQRNGTEDGTTTGFTALTAAIASSTTQALQGDRSLRVITAGAGEGVRTDFVAASESTAYAGSVYVYSATAAAFTLELYDNRAGATLIGTVSGSVFANKWNRLTVTGSTGAGATQIRMQLTQTSGGAVTWYLDGFQIEAGSIATTWVDGTRAAGDLSYASPIQAGATDLTVNFWARMPNGNAPAETNLFALTNAAGTHVFRLYRPSGTEDLRLATAGGTSDNFDLGAAFFVGSWNMITAVLRRNAETGEIKKKVYFNGNAYADGNSPASTALPDLSQITRLDIGHLAGAGRLGAAQDCLIDDFMVLPYAAPEEQINAWRDMGKAVPSLPEVYVDGDFIPDDALTLRATGEALKAEYVRAQDGSVWRANQRRLSFELVEA